MLRVHCWADVSISWGRLRNLVRTFPPLSTRWPSRQFPAICRRRHHFLESIPTFRIREWSDSPSREHYSGEVGACSQFPLNCWSSSSSFAYIWVIAVRWPILTCFEEEQGDGPIMRCWLVVAANEWDWPFYSEYMSTAGKLGATLAKMITPWYMQNCKCNMVQCWCKTPNLMGCPLQHHSTASHI